MNKHYVANINQSSLNRSHPDVTWMRVFRKLDRTGQGLNIQIRRSIVYAVESGIIEAGDRLPSSRYLAGLLGVARNTVTGAYQLLIDEGVLVSRERSGIFVAERNRVLDKPFEEKKEHTDWSSKFAIKPSELRHFSKPRDWMSYPYPFLYGQFDSALFPTNNWREAIRATSSVQEISGWAGDLIDEDDPDLIEQLRVHVLPRRGIFTKPGEIIITLGSQQALSMMMELFAKNGQTRVGIEDPGYPDVRNMAELVAGGYQSLAMDTAGAIPDETFASCDITFLTVNQQCPSTGVMPVDRRKDILKTAYENNVLIVEDDYEADLNPGQMDEPSSLKSLDKNGNVVYIGSFSKALAPGLRIGYIVAPTEVIDELRVYRRLVMRHPPTNNQRILATFIGLGHYYQHLQKTSETLLRRADLIALLLPKVMPQCKWRHDPGAMSFWIELPDHINCRKLEKDARDKGVLIEGGDIFFTDPQKGKNFIRLGFTSIAESHIESGLRILGSLIK